MTRYNGSPEGYQDTHHLECPRCGHHSIISRGEGKFACLRCNWQRDVASEWGENPPIFVLIAIAIILIIVITGL